MISKYTVRIDSESYSHLREQAKSDGIKLASLFVSMVDSYIDKTLPESIIRRARDLRLEVIERAYADRTQAVHI
jgi:hypothetical protein